MPNAGYPVVTRTQVQYRGKPDYFASELARLAAAPAVWAVTEAGWTEIDVVSDSLRIERPGTLQRLSLEIRPRQRGGRL